MPGTKEMGDKEREILEKELQKEYRREKWLHTSKSRYLRGVEDFRQLLDESASLEEIQNYYHGKNRPLKPDEYYSNAIPLASWIYWYARKYGRDDVCCWAIDIAETIDGLLDIQELEHQKKVAIKFEIRDVSKIYGERELFLHDEPCWTNAPNHIVAALSGNVSLLERFENIAEEQGKRIEAVKKMPRRDMPNQHAKKLYYFIRRGESMDQFCIPNLLTAVILSGSIDMLEWYAEKYHEVPSSAGFNGEDREALGKAIAGAGKEMSEHILEYHVELLEYVRIEQVLKAGNPQLLDYFLYTNPDESFNYTMLFINTRDMTIPYASAPGTPRGLETDTEMYRVLLKWKAPDFPVELLREQIREDIIKPESVEFPEVYPKRAGYMKHYWFSGFHFDASRERDSWRMIPRTDERKRELFKLYQELGGTATKGMQNALADAVPMAWGWIPRD